MAIDYNATSAGLATGMALPTKNTGMADLIKSITNDMRAAASSRAEAAQKSEEEATKKRGQNVQMFSALASKGYRMKEGANAEDFLTTGDLSVFQAPPTEAEQLQQVQRMVGGQGGGLMPQGTTMKVGNFNIPLNPPQTPERAQTISALETMGSLLNDMQSMLKESPYRVMTGNILGVNAFDRQANAIFRQYDKTAAIAAGGKQLTQTELGLIASNRPTVADAGDPQAMAYKMNNLRMILTKAHDRLTRGLAGETQMGAAGDMLNQGGGYQAGQVITGPDGNQYIVTGGDPNDPDVIPYNGE